jgi:ABA4-like protein
MKAEQIFSIAGSLAMISWLLLIILPRRRFTKVVAMVVIPLFFSAAYLALIIVFFGSSEGGFGSLADVMKLFTNEWIVLAGWLHYLAFDLFVGSWEVREAHANGIPHLIVVPCLVLTFLFGPIGFLLFTILKFFLGKGGENDLAAS